MSTVNQIKNKKVDYQILNTVPQISTEEDHGKLSAVIFSDDSTAIYVGDTPIASGYGFKNEATKKAVEELISNENIKKLLSSDLNINDDVVPIPDQGETVLEDSSITLRNNDTISIENGVLKSKSWLNIIDIKVGYKIDDETNYIYNQKCVDVSMLKNVIIDSLKFSFTISFDMISLKYAFIFDDTIYDDSKLPAAQTMNNLSLDGNIFDGKVHSMSLENLNISLNKDITKLNSEIPINIYFCDADKKYQTKINIGTLIFKYPIFTSFGEDFIISDYDFSNQDNLYDIEKGCNVNISTENENCKHYILVPIQLSNPVFILRKSNIGCEFNIKVSNYNLNNSDHNLQGIYNVYESPQEYNTSIDWIVK